MAAMTRGQFRKQLQEGLNSVFGFSYKRYSPQWKDCFETFDSKKAWEEDVLLVGLGGAVEKGEGAAITYDEGGESYVATYVSKTFGLAFSITQEAIDDGLYGSIGSKYSRSLARSLQYTKEVEGASILNNSDSSSYPGGDGVSLINTSHPLWGGGVGSNTLSVAADLSEAALEDACIDIMGFVDDRGIPIQARAKKLIIPRQLGYEAERILKSSLRVGTANNDLNALKTRGSVPGGYAENIYLADPDAWWLLTDVEEGLKHMRRHGVRRGIEGDFETNNRRYKAYERYDFGWTDWRGIYGSMGAA
jgi:hypothetical protein